jgi:hypothetical protein
VADIDCGRAKLSVTKEPSRALGLAFPNLEPTDRETFAEEEYTMSCIHNFKKFSQSILLATTVLTVPGMASAQPYDSKSLFVLDNPGDLNFNQLLGINDNQIIVGYFGDGNVIVNNGYVLVPKFHYANENFEGIPLSGHTITQTQSIGINNSEVPITVGFWADQNNVQFGWANIRGGDVTASFQTILDPNGAPNQNQNLLGVNKNNLAAGFWSDAGGKEHGFVVNLAASPLQFSEVPPSLFNGAVATQVSGINDNNQVCGFWMDAKGNDHGFYGQLGGKYTTFNVFLDGHSEPSTQVLGCSNKFIVGSYLGPSGNTHAFLFDGTNYTKFDAPGSSQTAAFGVAGTAINGVNDRGDFVGFFSDGKIVHGFVKFAVATGIQ